MSKKARRVQMLIEIKNSIDSIRADSKNQHPESIENNMRILAESVMNVLAIDGVVGIPANSKVNSL